MLSVPYHKSMGFVTEMNQLTGKEILMLSRKQVVVFRCFVLQDHIYHLKKTLYRSLIECHYRYGNFVWGNCGEILLNKLQKIPNGAARIITGSDYDAPSKSLLLELGWSNIQELVTHHTVVMMHESKYNLALENI